MAEMVQIRIEASDEDFVGLYDVIEVWRSTIGEGGPFEELTGSAWKAARVPRDAGDQPSSPVTGASVNIAGAQLTVRLHEDEEDEITVTFTGPDPRTYAQVATQITAQGMGSVIGYVDALGVLVVSTTEPGTGAALRIVESDAASLLGLPTEEPDSLSYGKDARIPLIEGQNVYTFVDKSGSSEYFYKTRLRNSGLNTNSEYSLVFSPKSFPVIDSSNLVKGVLELVTLEGKALAYREVRVYATVNGTLIGGYLVAGTDLVKSTDLDGYVEFELVRGQKVTVAIAGTDIVRDITVPTDQSTVSFNLLDPSIAGEDVFKVQVPEIVYAERRSL